MRLWTRIDVEWGHGLIIVEPLWDRAGGGCAYGGVEPTRIGTAGAGSHAVI